MGKGLTVTLVFDAMSLNYGEGLGNISELKKLSKNGNFYSYISRQAIRYEIYKSLKENFSIDDKADPLTAENQVIQFKTDANISDYIEVDLFGYMKTKKGSGSATRPAVVRISPAIALEPFINDVEFGTNKNFADRAKENPDPFQFEHHHSLYSYTVTIDIDRVGKDINENIEITQEQKADRILKLLDSLKILNRDIKGRTESLNPLFVIGGMYNVKNPFFLNRISVTFNRESRKYFINNEVLKSTAEMTFNNEPVKNYTMIGYINGFWNNEDSFKEITEQSYNISEFFDKLKTEVENYYKKIIR